MGWNRKSDGVTVIFCEVDDVIGGYLLGNLSRKFGTLENADAPAEAPCPENDVRSLVTSAISSDNSYFYSALRFDLFEVDTHVQELVDRGVLRIYSLARSLHPDVREGS